MKMTPLDIRGQQFKKSFRGYDVHEVEALRELSAESLEEALERISELEEKLNRTTLKLAEHEERETILKETITTAQKMVEDIKNNARKEAELIIAEARQQSEDITRQAQARTIQLQEEIMNLKKQRIELETNLKAVLDYHSNILLLGEDEARKADSDAEKLKFLKK